jgi:anaphase-promoting complex subunit 2
LASTNDNTVEKFWDPKWEPEPNDAAPEFRTGKTADVVGTLVSIYETREVIVDELQAYLAMRLLAINDYDSVKEVSRVVFLHLLTTKLRTIELLKIRFGEEALHVCDVMLKDMADSKRIDDHVHGDIDVSCNATSLLLTLSPPVCHPPTHHLAHVLASDPVIVLPPHEKARDSPDQVRGRVPPLQARQAAALAPGDG